MQERMGSEFKKIQRIQRRSPEKYMKNPNNVFYQTIGSKNYTWRDHDLDHFKIMAKQNGGEQLPNTFYSSIPS